MVVLIHNPLGVKMVDPVSGVTFNKLLNTINRNRSGLQNSMKRISSGRKQNWAARPTLPRTRYQLS
ncbi:MAG: hypothetical protein ACKVK9_10180 [Nitrospinaceae bacterium]